jgi:hypothetical protein
VRQRKRRRSKKRKNGKKKIRDRRFDLYLEEGLSSRAHLRSCEGAPVAAAAAAAAAAFEAAAWCEEVLPPPFVTVDQPPPPLELSSTSAEEDAAAATAADVDDEDDDDASPAVVADAPVPPAPGAPPPPADHAELTKPEELLSDAAGFCDGLFLRGWKKERKEVRWGKNADVWRRWWLDVGIPRFRIVPPLDLVASLLYLFDARDQETVSRAQTTRGARSTGVFRPEANGGGKVGRCFRSTSKKKKKKTSPFLALSFPYFSRGQKKINVPPGSSRRAAIAASERRGRRTFFSSRQKSGGRDA